MNPPPVCLMKIEIFTEGSNTTADRDSSDTVRDFFRGQFRPVRHLAESLEDYGDVTVHILSEQYGYLTAGDPVSNISRGKSCEADHEFSEIIGRSARAADVIVVLLTSSVFENIIANQWDKLISNSSSDTIWFFGVSRSAMNSVDLEQLRANSSSVDVYERVGVARIDSESKRMLMERVKEKDNIA